MNNLDTIADIALGTNLKFADLENPDKFIDSILQGIATSQRRITLSALYLGIGENEQKIINAVQKALEDPSKSELEITFIFDHSRAQRGAKNSVSMVQGLVDVHYPRVKVLLYQVPQLRGFMYKYVPFQFRELFGVYHCKFATFDDSVILTGANLSHEYFTARQDRYYYIQPDSKANHISIPYQNCSVLRGKCADVSNLNKNSNNIEAYLTSFVKIVQRDCFELLPNSVLQTPPGWGTLALNEGIRKDLTELSFTVMNSNPSMSLSSAISSTIATTSAEPSTVTATVGNDGSASQPFSQPHTKIYPIVQHNTMSIMQESNALSAMCAPEGCVGSVMIATPYANFKDEFLRLLVRRSAKPNNTVQLTVPTIPAHGFGTGKGFLGFVPALHHYMLHVPLYALLAESLDIGSFDFQLRYFMREKYTYHSKGIWWLPSTNTTPPNDSTITTDTNARTETTVSNPTITYLGSSNFSERSWGRDFELGFLIFTEQPEVSEMFAQEYTNLQSHCGVVRELHHIEHQPSVTVTTTSITHITTKSKNEMIAQKKVLYPTVLEVQKEQLPQYVGWQRRGLYWVARFLRSIL